MLDAVNQAPVAERYYEKIAYGIPVEQAVAELEAKPELWDVYNERTRSPASPNYGCHDIWIRFRERSELTEPAKYGEPHFPVFYPAWHELPAVQAIIWGIVGFVKPVMLGGILITKVPPGKQIKPHDDRGAWNAEFMNFKVWIPLKTNARVVCRFPTGGLVMKAGSAFRVNNLVPHSVENYGGEDRITLIMTMRSER